MVRCQKCNTKLQAKARFCNKCGFSRVDIDETKPLSSSDAPQSLPQSNPASEPVSLSDTPQPTIFAETSGPFVEPAASTSTILPDNPNPITPSGEQNQGQAEIDNIPTQTMVVVSLTVNRAWTNAEIDNIPTQTMAEPAQSTPSPGPNRTIRTTKSSKRPANPAIPAQQDTVGQLPGKSRAIRWLVHKGLQRSLRSAFQFRRARGVGRGRRHRIRRQYQQSTVAPVQSTQDHPASTGNVDQLPTQQVPVVDIKSQLNLNGTYTPLRSSSESFAATSRMAERWRNSWRDRQRDEAGSAEGVSRGQSSVAIPLMARQNSRRATMSNNQKQGGRYKELGFWITVFLMVCLVAGLAVYIISIYLPNAVSGAAHVVPPSETAQPALSLQGPQSATIKQAQTLILHGEQFGANDTITFLLDGSTPIKDENGKIISVKASNAGRFDVSIPIQGSDWSADSHYILAVDDRTKQNAYLNIVVSPASTPEVTSPNLALSMQGKPVIKLTFNAVVGQGDPNQRRVTLTNTSRSPLHWTAMANAVHNLSWLLINDNHTSGNLNIGGTDSVGIGVLTAGLKSKPLTDPYTGQIVFTINGQEQLTLPVELQVADPQPEIVFSPNPVVALLGAGKTCQLTALTLINLGNSFINWTLVPYDQNTKDRIQFMANGQIVTQGTLAPSGESGDTKILNLQCNGVSAGDTYKFTMYAGSASWLVTIFI
jgi:hypothetical protein